jgi:class 3 adenylate cyclase
VRRWNWRTSPSVISRTFCADSDPVAPGCSRSIGYSVTALFADIKGLTELMEDLDPEEHGGLSIRRAT